MVIQEDIAHIWQSRSPSQTIAKCELTLFWGNKKYVKTNKWKQTKTSQTKGKEQTKSENPPNQKQKSKQTIIPKKKKPKSKINTPQNHVHPQKWEKDTIAGEKYHTK